MSSTKLWSCSVTWRWFLNPGKCQEISSSKNKSAHTDETLSIGKKRKKYCARRETTWSRNR